MKYSRIFCLLTVLTLAFYIYGCSMRPTESIQRTEQTKKEAAAEHAEQFALDFWNAGEKAWQEASAMLDAQKYREADQLLLKAKTNYTKARDLAKSKREEAIRIIKSMQVTASLRLKSDLMENPAASKLSPARKKELDAEIKRIQDNIAKVDTLLQNAQYSEADTLARKSARDVYEIQQEYLKK
jgi:hypothetical protein